jgi:hypothetical protein
MRLSRPLKNSLLLLPLVFAAQKICAQPAPADDFFNGGAQLYISNNIPAALEKTEGGLKLYPNDEKLKKLEELLKQQQQNQQSQSQQQKQDQQKNQQPNQQQQNSQSQKKPDEQKQDQSGQKKDEPQKSPEQKTADEKQNGEGQTNAPGQMTPSEAKRLLDAQKGDEQLLQLKPKGKPQDNQKPVKDW